MFRKQRGQIHSRLMALFIVVGLIGAFLVPLRGNWWLPALASEHGAATDRLFIITLAITATVFVIVQLTLAYLVWRYPYREGRRAEYFLESTKMEMTWTIVPAVIMTMLIFSGARLWAQIYYTKVPDGAFVVEVTGEQFKWAFRYPGKDGKFGRTKAKLIDDENPLGVDPDDPASQDDIVIPPGQGELHIPVHRPVEVRLRSKDVLHSFFLPHMRVKQDAVPGMTGSIWFVPTQTTAERKGEIRRKTERIYTLRELRRLIKAGLPFMSAEAYKDQSGEEVVGADAPLLADSLEKLQQAGHERIKAYQDFNFEIVCAELCGLGHYQMKGTVVVAPLSEVEEWLSEQTPFGEE
ncbi:MAG: cytochrome c oxidase subunit II [Abditibacteriales bacterium]|nr:cytochrome c oxidase subunit II [Abditibacteriales bacterium]